MSVMGNGQERIDFNVDKENLYREEVITDLKVASIRRLVPVTPEGVDDASRTPVYVGTTQLMTPQGPLPLQTLLKAGSFTEALDLFPAAMERAMAEMLEELQRMHEEEKRKNDSRIIVP